MKPTLYLSFASLLLFMSTSYVESIREGKMKLNGRVNNARNPNKMGNDLTSEAILSGISCRGGGDEKKHNLPTLLYGPSDQIPPKAGPLHIFPAMIPSVFKYLDLAFQLTFMSFGWLLLTSTAAKIWKVIAVVHGLSLLSTESYGGNTTPHGGKYNPIAKFPLVIMYLLDYVIVATAILTPLLGVDGYANGPLGDLRWLFYTLGPAAFLLLTSFEPST